ncbi:MAG: hypothetical protein Q7I92_02925, partial [Humidesulfovibrio sp.]|nr:hypothetical protein [Humidesulfovibrio sp.]
MRHERHPLRPAALIIMGLVLVVLTAAAALAESWGEVRVVETPTNVRQQRDPKSSVVRTLQPGEKVRVDNLRPSGWGTVFELDATERDESKALGFADVRLLKPVDGAGQPAATPAAASAIAPASSRSMGQAPPA